MAVNIVINVRFSKWEIHEQKSRLLLFVTRFSQFTKSEGTNSIKANVNYLLT